MSRMARRAVRMPRRITYKKTDKADVHGVVAVRWDLKMFTFSYSSKGGDFLDVLDHQHDPCR